jgi:hypothetical protein
MLFKKAYGVDAYGPTADEQSEAAALHLKESYQRTKDWNKAMAGFNGGRSAEKGTNTTDENLAYAARTSEALANSPPTDSSGEDWKSWSEASTSAKPGSTEAGPGHTAIIRKMDSERNGSQPYIPEPNAIEKLGMGAIRYGTGRVLPAAEDFFRGRLGVADRKHIDPTTGQPYSYLTQPVTDFVDKTLDNMGGGGGWAKAGEAAAGLPLAFASGAGMSGEAGLLVNILRNAGASAVPEMMLAPHEGETRLGNAAQTAAGTGAATGILGALGRPAMWAIDKLRGPEFKAGKDLVNAAGGRAAAEAGVDAVAPNATGVAATPASRAGVPGWEDLERVSRNANPGAFQTIDQLTADTARAAGRASRDTLWQSLSKTRVNDLHRKDIADAIESSGLRDEFKNEMKAILAQYGKGSRSNLKDLIDHLIQGSQTELKTSGGKLRLLPAEQEKWGRQLEKVTERYFDPAAQATQTAAVNAINRDVARSRSLDTGSPNAASPFLDATGRILNSPAAGGVAAATGTGKVLNATRAGIAVARFLRAVSPKDKPALTNALAQGDEAGLRSLLSEYDRVSSQKERAQMLSMLLARGAGSATASAVPNP